VPALRDAKAAFLELALLYNKHGITRE